MVIVATVPVNALYVDNISGSAWYFVGVRKCDFGSESWKQSSHIFKSTKHQASPRALSMYHV